MSRNLKNWLTAYVNLMENTEPAAAFDRWTGLSIIASALRRKVNLKLGRLVYYPNIYVVFVAEPGVARKTQAIKYGVKFLEGIPEIKLSADSSTREAMIDDLQDSEAQEMMSDGTSFSHSSLCIVSKEFESFLGQKKENTRMLISLTDLFDCPDTFKTRTRHGPSPEIIRPWLTLLAATTPDSLASSLPATAIGGGLTSRVLFVWADKKKKPVAIPYMTQEEKNVQDLLMRDLHQISRMKGTFVMTKDCVNKWTDWYNNYDEDESGIRLCVDKSFNGWYSRKPSYIIKISMLISAAVSNNLSLEWHHIEDAIKEIKQVELTMNEVFKAIGKSEVTSEVATIVALVNQHKIISEKKLRFLVWRDLDASKFDNVVDTALKAGMIYRKYKGPDNVVGIWYLSKEQKLKEEQANERRTIKT